MTKATLLEFLDNLEYTQRYGFAQDFALFPFIFVMIIIISNKVSHFKRIIQKE